MTPEDSRRQPPEHVGPYRIEAKLGAGGMGTVYRAYDQRLDRYVALKHIHPERSQTPRGRERFLREARVAARLSHPVLVSVHDILEVEGGLWIVMELVEGEVLAQRLTQGPIPVAETLTLGHEVAAGLTAIHAAGILHRDLKGENIVVTPAGRARILDFGLATSDEPDLTLSSASGILGTPRAMAPEQARGEELTPASDLFALGVLLYEMLSGRSPFLAPSLLETLGRLCNEPHEPLDTLDLEDGPPPELVRLVDQLLAKDPAERLQSAAEAHTLLGRLAPRTEPDTPAVTASAPAPSTESTHRVERFRRRGERRQITVLSCELVGEGDEAGTAGAEDSGSSLDPEVLYEVLPRFRSLVSESIGRYGGYLGDFQGHRLVAYFGYPQAREDAAERALLTAQEILSQVDRWGSESPGIRARAGVHTGPAILLTPEGGEERLALGRTLDDATEIQEQAASGRVTISPRTQRLLERGGADPSAILLGRQHELELLIDRWKLACEGRGQAVLVQGERGMGKTALLQFLQVQLGESLAPKAWWSFGGSSTRQTLPLWPLASLLQQLLGEDLGGQDLDGDPPSAGEARTRIDALLERHGLPSEDLGELLLGLLRVAEHPGRPLTPAQRREIVGLLVELVLEIVDRNGESQGATVLVVEDLQWLDAGSLELAHQLVEQCAVVPLLLVLTRRPRFELPWGRGKFQAQLHLGALEEAIGRELLTSRLEGRSIAPIASTQLIARAAGNPGVLVALADDWARKAADGTLPGIPTTWVDPLLATLDSLGSAKDLAQLAAALDRPFSLGELAWLWPGDTQGLAHEAKRLVTAGFWETIDANAKAFRFRQPLLRQAALASLLEEDREWLGQRFAANVEDSTLLDTALHRP